jgi:hypothetical protein
MKVYYEEHDWKDAALISDYLMAATQGRKAMSYLSLLPPSTPTVGAGSRQQPQEAQPQESETLPVPRTLLRYLAQDREGWKFQFLNQFLVHNTKSVLAWFAERPSATLEEYDRTWRFSIPEPEQRSRWWMPWCNTAVEVW